MEEVISSRTHYSLGTGYHLVSPQPREVGKAGTVNEEMTSENLGWFSLVHGGTGALCTTKSFGLCCIRSPTSDLCLLWKRNWTGGCFHPDFSITPPCAGYYSPAPPSQGAASSSLRWQADALSLSFSTQVAKCGNCDRGQASGTKVMSLSFPTYPLLPVSLD